MHHANNVFTIHSGISGGGSKQPPFCMFLKYCNNVIGAPKDLIGGLMPLKSISLKKARNYKH